MIGSQHSHQPILRSTLCVLLSLSLAWLLPGCTPLQETSSTSPTTSRRISQTSETEASRPFASSKTAASQSQHRLVSLRTLRPILNPLLATDPDAFPLPQLYAGLLPANELSTAAETALVQHYELGDRQIMLYLHPFLTWQDGSVLTSQDIVFSLEKLHESPAPWAQALAQRLVRIEALDDNSLLLHYQGAEEIFLTLLRQLRPIPRHLWSKLASSDWADAEELLTRAVGSGSYRLQELNDSKIVLQAQHEKVSPQLMQIRYVNTREEALADSPEADEIQIGVPQSHEPLLNPNNTQSANFQSQHGNARSSIEIQFNTLRGAEALKSPELRRELLALLDLSRLAIKVDAGLSPSFLPFPSNLLGLNEAELQEIIRLQNSEKEEQAKAGTQPETSETAAEGDPKEKPTGTPAEKLQFRLLYDKSNPILHALAPEFQTIWQTAGYDIDLLALSPEASRINAENAHGYDLLLLERPLTPSGDLLPNYVRVERYEEIKAELPFLNEASHNLEANGSEELDRLLLRFESELPDENRGNLRRELLQVFRQELPVLPLFLRHDYSLKKK